MGFDWFRVDSALTDHPKVLRLAADLKDPNAGWYIIRLWSWLSRYAPRGRLRDDLQAAAESAAGWRGEPRGLLNALLRVGMMEEDADGTLEAHDWWEKQGPLVEKANKDAARQRKRRKEMSRGRSADGHADDMRDGAGRGRTDETDETDGRDVLPRPNEKLETVRGAPLKPTAAPAPFGPVGAFRDAMDAIFALHRDGAKYGWTSLDENAVGALLGQASSDHGEILRRWAICLSHTHPTYDTVTELSKFWNKCAAAQPAGPPRPADPRKSPVRAEDIDPAAFAKGATSEPF
ncbi:MAG: hypothetical protein WC876_01670 [Candidatus Thermoplasmatota archaeon]|jgi:hypothetical protein